MGSNVTRVNAGARKAVVFILFYVHADTDIYMNKLYIYELYINSINELSLCE